MKFLTTFFVINLCSKIVRKKETKFENNIRIPINSDYAVFLLEINKIRFNAKFYKGNILKYYFFGTL